MPHEPSRTETVTTVPALPRRPADSNKGSFGKVLVVAGSRGMTGAAILCGSAALRGGAGLVRVAVPRDLLAIVAIGNPCYMTVPLAQDADGRLDSQAEHELLSQARAHDVMAIGPGLGRGSAMTTLLAKVLDQLQMPIVLDADGLNAFVQNTTPLKRSAPLILTPHPGEFSRLLNIDVATVQAHRRDLAVAFAEENGLVLLLKGKGTIVTDGRRVYQNTTGNPGMATAGCGDVLTGLIAALLGQGLEPFAAAQLGAYVHGLAGDLARDSVGEVGMIASDVLEKLPHALQKVHGDGKPT